MATQRTLTYLDDLDGTSPADELNIPFAVDGRLYTMDLTNRHAHEFREDMAKWVSIATDRGKLPKLPHLSAVPNGSTVIDTGKAGITKEEGTAIREWANQNGFAIGNRGRIPNVVMEKYNEAQAPKPAAAKPAAAQPAAAKPAVTKPAVTKAPQPMFTDDASTKAKATKPAATKPAAAVKTTKPAAAKATAAKRTTSTRKPSAVRQSRAQAASA